MYLQAAILAGGKNSRYGGFHKAFIEIEGKRIIERNLDVLQTLFDPILIIANQCELFYEFGLEVYPDIFPGLGPIAGIHSALKNTKAEAVFVSSCDMPFLNDAVISKLIEGTENGEYDVVIPRHNHKIEPLCAIYHRRILPQLETFIENDSKRAVRKFINMLNVKFIDFDAGNEKAFTNINRPEDLSAAAF